MLAAKNEYLNEASQTLYKLTEEEKVRLRCEALEELNRIERTWEMLLEDAYNEKEAAKIEIAAANEEIARLKAELEKLQKSV